MRVSKIMKTVLFFLNVLMPILVSDSYNVLVIFPMPVKSHMILGDGVVRHLLKAGHHVTLVTAFPRHNSDPDLHIIDVSRGSSFFSEQSNHITSVKNALDGTTSYEFMKNFMFVMGNQISSFILKDENFQMLLADRSLHFDVVIAEWFHNELFGSIGAIYQAPFIWMSTTEPHWMILRLIDESLNPTYNGYYITEQSPFTFSQRVQELWFTIKQLILKYTLGRFLDQKAYKGLIAHHFESRDRIPPPYEELQYNASLILGNSHVSMGEATRLPQNYINIGGYHIEDDMMPLPDVLNKIINEAKHGAIYFSMGTNLQSKDFPEIITRQLLEVFGSLKQTIVWKFESTLKNVPENVHIIEWTPQQSILAHPNVILFITHGGLLSTTEAIHAGKPIIGIPVLSDQFLNVDKAVNNGFAIKIPLSYDIAGQLKDAILEVFRNTKYAERAKYLSSIYHDRPIKPGAEMVHWVEHVIKTNGAPHLRSPALMVPWYQKLYLDLLALVVLVLIILKLGFKSLCIVITKIRICNQKNN